MTGGCSIHGTLPHSYALASDGQYYFILESDLVASVAIRSYSRDRSYSSLGLSTRVLNGREYFRLLDSPNLRVPTILVNSTVIHWYCPVCKYDSLSWGTPELRRLVHSISERIPGANVGISGSSLVDSPDARDCDVVFYDIDNSETALQAIDYARHLHGAIRLSSWRRLQCDGNALCLILKARKSSIRLSWIPWNAVSESESVGMHLVVTCATEGHLSPAIYRCVHAREVCTARRLGMLLLLSIQPGHAGLLGPGDQLNVRAVEVQSGEQAVALVDPRNPWIDVLPRNEKWAGLL